MSLEMHLESASFLMEGLHDAGYKETLKAYNESAISLISELNSYVPYLERMIAACDEFSFPGVVSYEVASPFGKWWAEQVQKGDQPLYNEGCKKLRTMFEDFMAQGTTRAEAAKIVQRLALVHPYKDLPELGKLSALPRGTIIPPESGWEQQTYYVVDVSFKSSNPIHRAILYVGFMGSTPLNGGYTCLFCANHDPEVTRTVDPYYLRVINKIEGL